MRPILSLMLLFATPNFAETFDFPSHVQLRVNNLIYTMDKTGETTKGELYSIAHYLQGAIEAQERVILVQIFSDGEAKEFLIEWMKDFKQDEIKKELKSSFEKALDKKELAEHEKEIASFINFFNQDVKAKDQIKILWMAKGQLQVFYGSDLKGEINSIPFAKAVWKVWLGPKSVVNKSLLIDDYIDIQQSY
ncbi:chalcone isomerase family protein [Estrella lausannensis]|uniref:Putative chalcone isomerase n=1 Tax=Estrella lausannensis TaxID=483423 RepID=A0A0H5DS28_9BACT|nr:chalcone isomerase family protein [Estrella lausannensis]CRX39526.1 Putative chalcone isomerase [Estrella lausannensis]